MRTLPLFVALAGALAFLALGGWLCDRLPTWHEEVSIQSNLGYRVLGDRMTGPASGPLPVEPWCGDGSTSRIRWVESSSRPDLSLCVAGRSLPVMTMPYASGVFAWPLLLFEPVHHDDVFVERQIGLVRGLLALTLLFLLARRIAGAGAASLACLLAGVSAPFVYPHVLLFPYETMPWTLVASAFWVWSGCGELAPRAPRDGPAPSTRRLLAGAALAGLAVLANVKAVFLFVPLLALAAIVRVPLRRVRPRQWIAMGVVAAVACAPLWVFALLDPSAGLAHQAGWRLAVIARKARPAAMAKEALNLLTFGSDVGFYLEEVGGRAGTLFVPGLVAVAAPIAYAIVAACSRVVRRPVGSALAATCGALLGAYYLVSLLLYDQYLSANYAPLHCVFGATYAAFCVDAGRWLARLAGRRGRSIPAALPTAALAVPLAAVLVWATVRRGDPGRYMGTSINAVAERQAAAYLLEHPSARGEVVTTTYNLAGVMESLGRGELHPVQAHPLIEGCRGTKGDALSSCVHQRLRWLLGHEGSLPMRILYPSVVSVADTPAALHRLVPDALRAEATALGLDVSTEAGFRTAAGVEVLRLMRVARPEAHGAPASAPAPHGQQ